MSKIKKEAFKSLCPLPKLVSYDEIWNNSSENFLNTRIWDIDLLNWIYVT